MSGRGDGNTSAETGSPRRGSGAPAAIAGLRPSAKKSSATHDEEIQFEESIEDRFPSDPSQDEFIRSEGKGIVYSLVGPNGEELIYKAHAANKEEAKERIEKVKASYREKVLAKLSAKQERKRRKEELLADYKKQGIDLTSIFQSKKVIKRILDKQFSDIRVEKLPGGYKVLICASKYKKEETGGHPMQGGTPVRKHIYAILYAFDEKGNYLEEVWDSKQKPIMSLSSITKASLLADLKKQLKRRLANDILDT